MRLPQNIFVTGTDTGVGKTVISAMLVVGLNYEYWKPVQSGLLEETDTAVLRRLTALPDRYFHKETYGLTRPLSPHAAAAHDGVEIDLAAFSPPRSQAVGLIVEGAGGIMVPLNDRHFMLDLMKKLGFPVLLVSRSALGAINHTLLSLEQIRRHGLEVLGVVLNGPLNPDNREAIHQYGRIPILAEIEPLDRLDRPHLEQAFARFDFKRPNG